MADKLRERLVKIGVELTEFYPARGYWTHAHQDVLAWTGKAKVPGVAHEVCIGSWDSATECARRGIRSEITPASRACSGHFEIAALPRKKSKS